MGNANSQIMLFQTNYEIYINTQRNPKTHINYTLCTQVCFKFLIFIIIGANNIINLYIMIFTFLAICQNKKKKIIHTVCLLREWRSYHLAVPIPQLQWSVSASHTSRFPWVECRSTAQTLLEGLVLSSDHYMEVKLCGI